MTPVDPAWTPGAHELERFREDLYLRINATTASMSEQLNRGTDAILAAVESAAKSGALHPERADVEYEKVADLAEHERFVYNWALVMLTTRTIDTFKHLIRAANNLVPPCPQVRGSELDKLTNDFQARCNIHLADAPTGIDFLDGMRLARNKIVHNAGNLYELSSDPNPIQAEDDAPWQPSMHDRDFVQRFPAYADADRITVTKELFEQQTEYCLTFVTYVTERFDRFVQLLSAPAGKPS
jgi:hypothetical protein